MLLSDREKECLGWAAAGKSSWDIAVILSISENTVNFHVKNAMKKLGATRRTLAIVKAISLGLIDPPFALDARDNGNLP
jgi:LuxR family transcriptional activator of conjugal transfer of Ti plasmids